MSFITAQQSKLDLEIVPKEKRMKIRKCNERLNHVKIQREPTFQFILDALALTSCYFSFLITTDVPEVYMHQFWDLVYKHDTFYRFKIDKRKRFKLTLEIFKDIFKICPRVHGQDFDALPTNEEVVTFLRELGHTGEINSLNDVVVDHMHQLWRTFAALIIKSLSGKTTGIDMFCLFRAQILWEETQIYGAILPECLTSLEMKETQAYNTYLGFATGATPLKKAQKFKKPASPKLNTVLVSTETPTGKSNRVKRHAMKCIETLARGVVIRETPEMPLTKKKKKVDVVRGKGIELLSQVALTEDDQIKEVRKKSMRDFHKTHSSGSGTVTKTAPCVAKIKPSATNDSNNKQVSSDEDNDQEKDNDDDKTQSDNEHELDLEHETDESESGSESDHDESEENKEVNDEDETKITNKTEGDEDEEMDYTTSQLYDDVDIRLNEPVDTRLVQEEDAKIVSPLDVHIHHEVPSQQTPTLLTVPVSAVLAKESSQPQSLYEAAATLTKFELKKILIDKIDKMYSLKRSRKEKDKDEDPSAGSDRELKKRKTSKDAEPAKGPIAKESQFSSSKGDKSKSKSSGKSVQSEEPEFEVADFDMPHDQEENLDNDDEPKEKPSKTFDELMSTPIDFSAFIINSLNINNLIQETLLGPAFRLLKGTRSNYAELEYDFEQCYKALSEKLDWENPKGDDYPFDLTKPIPLVKI
nr:hypothetical protein [Tanacetum cinerariifolium]